MCTRMWLLLILIVLAGCAQQQPERPVFGKPGENPLSPQDALRQRARSLTDDTAAVFGTVVGEDGTPIQDAVLEIDVVSDESVRLSEVLQVTNAQGEFRMILPPAIYDISFEPKGFQRNTVRVELRPREARMLNFVLRRKP